MTISVTSHKYLPNGYIDYSVMAYTDKRHKPFEFETSLGDWTKWSTFAHTYWYVPIVTGVIYITLIFGIQHLMKERKAFELKTELFLWNAGIGLFSIAGFVRILPESLEVLFSGENSFYRSICVWEGMTQTAGFWAILFILSKFVELGDTVFIVLRKKPLQFLQWYHHILTLAGCWYTMIFVEGITRYYGVMNFGVHSLMYPYFALKALDIRIPRKIANFITTLQLVQMILGLSINVISAYYYYSGVPCLRHPTTLKLYGFIYASFAILFGRLFYNLVVQQKSKTKTK